MIGVKFFRHLMNRADYLCIAANNGKVDTKRRGGGLLDRRRVWGSTFQAYGGLSLRQCSAGRQCPARTTFLSQRHTGDSTFRYRVHGTFHVDYMPCFVSEWLARVRFNVLWVSTGIEIDLTRTDYLSCLMQRVLSVKDNTPHHHECYGYRGDHDGYHRQRVCTMCRLWLRRVCWGACKGRWSRRGSCCSWRYKYIVSVDRGWSWRRI